jgi:transposase
MYSVEVYNAVRRFVFIEGHSRREAARQFGISRETARKICRYSEPPGYQRKHPPQRPKLDPFTAIIDQILADDLQVHVKQRHTAKRIFERLRATSMASMAATPR